MPRASWSLSVLASRALTALLHEGGAGAGGDEHEQPFWLLVRSTLEEWSKVGVGEASGWRSASGTVGVGTPSGLLAAAMTSVRKSHRWFAARLVDIEKKGLLDCVLVRPRLDKDAVLKKDVSCAVSWQRRSIVPSST